MKRTSILLAISLALTLGYHACTFKNSVAHTYNRNIRSAPFDVIIVPGFPYDTAFSADKPLLNVRMYWAKELYEKGIARNIIFSGAAVHNAYVEAKIMKTIADSLGIPPQHTFVEEKSLHSNENVRNSYKLAKKLGFKKIAIATDPYQYSYMRWFLWYSAPKAVMLPFPLDSFPRYAKRLPMVDSKDAFIKDFVSPVD